jgi:hypothetical protein
VTVTIAFIRSDRKGTFTNHTIEYILFIRRRIAAPPLLPLKAGFLFAVLF